MSRLDGLASESSAYTRRTLVRPIATTRSWRCPQAIAAATNVAADDVATVRDAMRGIEPIGVGSRNIQESLLAQIAYLEELGETDLVLGVVGDASYTHRTLQLEPGDSLVLFTDGLSEAENMYGEELAGARFSDRLLSLHGHPAEAVTKTIGAVVDEHVGDAPVTDDVTLLVVSRAM